MCASKKLLDQEYLSQQIVTMNISSAMHELSACEAVKREKIKNIDHYTFLRKCNRRQKKTF